MYPLLLFVVFGSLLCSSYLSSISLKIAKKLRVLDDPTSRPNVKRQLQPIPLLGASGLITSGLLFSAFVFICARYNLFGLSAVLQTNLEQVRFGWVLLSILIILIGGFMDDKYNLKPQYLAIPISLAIFISVVFGNLQIEALSYPFNSFLPENHFLPYILGFIWIGFCTGATKFLDGLDGLVTSVGVITFLLIASISFFPNVFQPFTILLSLIWAASLVGYLPFNFPNAKNYLGEGGSQAIGFMIGVLSILSGAKVATVSLVIGWFILDIIFVFTLRLSQKNNPFKADRLHWHFRMLDIGLSKHQVLVLTTAIILITARVGLALPTTQKLLVLLIQFLILVPAFMVPSLFGKSMRIK